MCVFHNIAIRLDCIKGDCRALAEVCMLRSAISIRGCFFFLSKNQFSEHLLFNSIAWIPYNMCIIYCGNYISWTALCKASASVFSGQLINVKQVSKNLSGKQQVWVNSHLLDEREDALTINHDPEISGVSLSYQLVPTVVRIRFIKS